MQYYGYFLHQSALLVLLALCISKHSDSTFFNRTYISACFSEVAGIILVNPLYEGLFAMENGLWSKFW